MNCYRGFSLIPELYRGGSTGGVVSSLAYAMLQFKLVDRVLVSSPRLHSTYLAKDLNGLKRSQGSIYHNFYYYKPDVPEEFPEGIGQIGKPCDMDPQYSPRISLFCSKVVKLPRSQPMFKHDMIIFDPKWNQIPLKCRLCLDHIGKRSDISLGDSQILPKLNVIIPHTDLGRKLLKLAINHKYIVCQRMPKGEINQPWIYSGIKRKLIWTITKLKRFL